MVGKPSAMISLASVSLCMLHCANRVDAFASSPPHATSSAASSHDIATSLHSSFFADATTTPATKIITSEEQEQVDRNGRAFAIGDTVAVTSNNKVIKAYSLPKSGYGSFHPTTREFLPRDDGTTTRGSNCLVLSEGLRGVVKHVYNTNEWDRAHPILVKFTEGSDREVNIGVVTDDGEDAAFRVPKPFQMHFDASEIEVLDL
mmetsp:Transcript_13490/g.24410  ORF Transcript_13490/g.24410 Transcript_13490/m.24410 type:complete len:203 (+) Transcript_13490:164-772(+)|eukprot:CAMPEP_0201601242 /NCGR_PEP_ID=MMETSP0492-20130828/2241_1 /ASSEMBLY_ACC=CAM_ASM_000837 /TAXON_ID=420259 /ORGANISM="Thalassiosira gravida, Strain GMp14c1" /LENGTH=202 /DNA_ID=CAMNT_0048064383 /DNA_START=118 /DNA_END=726 /DNA_ORIENTATION=-